MKHIFILQVAGSVIFEVLFIVILAMATVEQMRAEIVKYGSSDFVFMLNEEEVPLEIQHRVITAGIKNLKIFAALEETRADFKKTMGEIARLDPASDNIEEKIAAASLMAAWQTAKDRVEAEGKAKAAADASGSSLPQPLGKKALHAMENSFVEIYGRFPESETAGETMMARRLQEVENDRPMAEPLTEVASVAEGCEEIAFHETGPDGGIRTQTRKIKKVPLPVDTEDLRLRHKLLENSFLKAKLKHGSKPWLSDVAPGTFTSTLSKYIMGEKVMKLEAARDMNVKVTWNIIIKYEHELRKMAFNLIREEGYK